MDNQLGFDFVGNTSASVLALLSQGSWLTRKFTRSEYEVKFAKAEAVLLGLSGVVRAMFAQGLERSKEIFTQRQTGSRQCGEDEAFDLLRSDFEPDSDTVTEFMQFCFAQGEKRPRGIEIKTRDQAGMTTAGVFIEDFGSVILRLWPDVDCMSVDFSFYRNPFFLESFRDAMPRIAAPVSIWGGFYCADKLAFSGAGVASVKAFALSGRLYINHGTSGRGSYRECSALTFCPLSDWRGETFSYQTQCKAWDDGRLERGDRRGLIVLVNGQKCVIDSQAIVFDENAKDADVCSVFADEELGDHEESSGLEDEDSDELLAA